MTREVKTTTHKDTTKSYPTVVTEVWARPYAGDVRMEDGWSLIATIERVKFSPKSKPYFFMNSDLGIDWEDYGNETTEAMLLTWIKLRFNKYWDRIERECAAYDLAHGRTM